MSSPAAAAEAATQIESDIARISPPYVVHVAEAQDKWCPEVRRFVGDDAAGYAGVNRVYDKAPAELAPCIGDQCAFWQWDDDEFGYCAKIIAPDAHHRFKRQLQDEARATSVEGR